MRIGNAEAPVALALDTLAMELPTMKCVPIAEDPKQVTRRHLADAANGWSVGGWGAIGEFQYDPDEPGLSVDLEALSAASPRGALHIGELNGAALFALVDDSGRTREIAFCSPRGGAGRTTIHELDEAIFDLGIGAPHIDMMVRLRGDDAATRAALRAGAGRPLLEPGNPAGPAIVQASPSRIFASALARLEVHQPIPAPGGRSPEGAAQPSAAAISEGEAGACPRVALAGWLILWAEPISPDTPLATLAPGDCHG